MEQATITVRLTNDGKPASGLAVVIASSGEGNVISQPMATGEDGSAQASLASTVAERKIVTVSVVRDEGSIPLDATLELEFVAGPPAGLRFLPAHQDVAVGRPFALAVGVVDSRGNVIPTASDEITLGLLDAPVDATLTGKLVGSTVEGEAHFPNLMLDRRGDYTFVATSGAYRATLELQAVSWFGIGPDGGQVTRIVPTAESSTLFAMTQRRVFKSEDGGQLWRPSHRGLPPAYLSGLLSDPSDPEVLYAASWDLPPQKSTDGGETWQASAIGLPPGAETRSLVLDPSDPARLYTVQGYEEGSHLFVSEDGAANWTQLLANVDFEQLAVAPSDPSTIYGYGYGEIHRSRDRGASWTMLDVEADPLVFEVDPTNAETLYLALYDGLWKSTDGGATPWVLLEGLPNFVTALLVDPDTPSRVYVGVWQNGVFESLDGGTSWAPASEDDFGGRIASLSMRGPSLYAATEQGPFVRTQTGTWTRIDKGLVASDVHAIAVSPANPDLVLAIASDSLSRSVDGGTTWTAIDTRLMGTPSFLRFAPAGDTVFVGTSNALFVSADAGMTWIESGLKVNHRENYANDEVTALEIDPLDPQTMYAALFHSKIGILHSTDGGATWAPWGSGLPPANFFSLLSSDSGELITGTQNGLYRKSGSGDWAAYAEGLEVGDQRRIRSLARLDGRTYCGTADGVFRRGPAQWEPAGLKGENVTTLVAVPGEDLLYAGTGSGLYLSTDGGGHWSLLQDGLPPGPIPSATVAPSDPGTVYAGTIGYGVFKSLAGGPPTP